MKYIREMIEAYGLGHVRDEILETVFSCIKLVPAPDEPVPLGASKAGGAPHLPAGQEQPDPAFLCQVNLAEMEAPGLPAHGLLYFFYENGASRVLFHEGSAEHLAVSHAAGPYPECRILPERTEKLPQLFFEDEDDDLRFLQMLEELDPDSYENHQMLGVPFSVHGEVLEELAAELDMPAESLVLLLQLDSDQGNLGMTWGEMGMLYFCMTRQDLQERRFDRVYCLQQSL
ncbi:YwqG family protein [Ectobacillus ponti]|uniref:YwqG family protein n=1 Tax=Ectobacillus ponti TaxID=2961894 RepID=A0AA42BSF9_9BACI|nr:YwqG family protein [Ectobacillus ponti]MCP8968398.1 YwqG family protein [Ectobacillus ponti]